MKWLWNKKDKLKIFTTGMEWYIAKDIAHVRELFLQWTGETFEDAGYEDKDWLMMDDNHILTMVIDRYEFNEAKGLPRVHVLEISEHYVKIKATAKEWIKVSPVGFLCSAEW